MPYKAPSDDDDELASRVALLQVPDRVRGLGERVGAVDGRSDLSLLGEVLEGQQVLVAREGDEVAEVLADEGGEQGGPDLAAHPAEEGASALAADHDEGAAGGEDAAQQGHGAQARAVDDDVVAVGSGGDVL